MTTFTPLSALAGGALIGLAASMFLYSHGKVAGISGLFGGMFTRVTDRPMRLAFVLGLVAAGVVAMILKPDTFPAGPTTSIGITAIAGLLVGFGTRMGNGCTSGHGVCGITRKSSRSLVATVTFIITGAISVLVVRHVVGG